MRAIAITTPVARLRDAPVLTTRGAVLEPSVYGGLADETFVKDDKKRKDGQANCYADNGIHGISLIAMLNSIKLLIAEVVKKKTTLGLILLCAVSLGSMTGPAQAYHMGETFKATLKTATVHGSYSKEFCSVQSNIRSARGKNVAFVIFWRPGKSLHLVATHPDYARAGGAQKVPNRFPDGQGMAYPMTRSGAKVQVNLGFGQKAQQFNRLVRNNRSLTIDLLGVDDRVAVDLREQDKVIAAIRKCRKEFLH